MTISEERVTRLYFQGFQVELTRTTGGNVSGKLIAGAAQYPISGAEIKQLAEAALRVALDTAGIAAQIDQAALVHSIHPDDERKHAT